MDYKIKFLPNDRGNRPGKLADAELYFTDIDVPCPRRDTGGHDFECSICGTLGTYTVPSPLAGLKLIGFGIWERRNGGRNVTFPARQYSVNGERRSFALLRPVDDVKAQERLRDSILEAYATYEAED